LTEQLIEQLGYVGIALILVLGGLGLPIPEEAPIILAAVLARNGRMWWPLAFASCLGGVLLGDFVVYVLGFFYGEKVLSLRLTRRLLTRQREAQIKGYFHRHGFKILVSGRFVPGFRTAAYLTAGILKLPVLKLLLTDLVAASLSTTVMFGLGFAFAYQIEKGIREVQQWVTVVVAVGVASWLLHRYYRARRRAGLPVGPPVLDSDEVPLPALDRHPPADPGDGLPAAPGPTSTECQRVAAASSDVAAPVAGDSRTAPATGSSPGPRYVPVKGGLLVQAAPSDRPSGPAGIDVDATPQPSVEAPSR
jgi:membrane protein DedA with SNARE-associated domain